jgi:peptide/nickel transport system permease protein
MSSKLSMNNRDTEEQYFVASQWVLMRRKFLRHKVALAGLFLLVVLYLIAVFCEFVAPHDPQRRNRDFIDARPQRVRLVHEGRLRLRPFVYPIEKSLDPVTLERIYTDVRDTPQPIYLFVRGDQYRLWGLIPLDIHLFGLRDGQRIFLFGADKIGRDLFSRTVYGARISLSIGLVGVGLSFVLGALLGGLSGYFGGRIDLFVQRVIEFLLAIPKIPLWMALAAALPPGWDPVKLYFGMTVILSLVGWTQIARVVRGKIMSLRQEDFVVASVVSGAGAGYVVVNHLLPGFLSYLIVSITLAVPQMILAETALSFLGLGLQPPAISWGVLLQDAQAIRSIAFHPWLLIPGLFVVLAVLAFNSVGDGLRDAADPYA